MEFDFDLLVMLTNSALQGLASQNKVLEGNYSSQHLAGMAVDIAKHTMAVLAHEVGINSFNKALTSEDVTKNKAKYNFRPETVSAPQPSSQAGQNVIHQEDIERGMRGGGQQVVSGGNGPVYNSPGGTGRQRGPFG